jgi:pimeloyl-ACP methyl ester carboxylesterase
MRAEILILSRLPPAQGWTVMDHLGAAGIPDARLRIIDRAGHNPHSERPDEVMAALREFLAGGGSG